MKGNACQDRHRYDDIIRLPHHVSCAHPPMPVAERAAQFSPFAALTGFEDAIREGGRLTESRIELGEDARSLLDEKLERIKRLQERSEALPEATITYFQPDEKKDGGAYVTVTGQVKKVDEYQRVVVLQEGERIALGEIVGMELGSELEEREHIVKDKIICRSL